MDEPAWTERRGWRGSLHVLIRAHPRNKTLVKRNEEPLWRERRDEIVTAALGVNPPTLALITAATRRLCSARASFAVMSRRSPASRANSAAPSGLALLLQIVVDLTLRHQRECVGTPPFVRSLAQGVVGPAWWSSTCDACLSPARWRGRANEEAK